MGDYPTAFAINTIYTYESRDGEVGYWYADMEDFPGEIGHADVKREKYTSYYQGPISDSLIVQFEPELGQCLWVLTPENVNQKLVPALSIDASIYTKLNRIKPVTDDDQTFLQDLLEGKFSRTATWCYYYQKADLSVQYEQWENATSLWQEAADKGFGPSNGIELFPFIKAYLHLGQFDRALTLSSRAVKISEGMNPILCTLWKDPTINAENQDFSSALTGAREILTCDP